VADRGKCCVATRRRGEAVHAKLLPEGSNNAIFSLTSGDGESDPTGRGAQVPLPWVGRVIEFCTSTTWTSPRTQRAWSSTSNWPSLRRQVARPRFSWSDRAVVATLTNSCPGSLGRRFLMTPETILHSHRTGRRVSR